MTTPAPRGNWYRWEDLPLEEVSSQLRRKVITGGRIMLVHAFRRAGGFVEPHQHDNDQFTYVMHGRLRFWLGPNDEQEVVVGPGEVLHVPPNVPHRAIALEDTMELDIFSPPRVDWTEPPNPSP